MTLAAAKEHPMSLSTATVHNPSNFEPADYEIFDALDNKRPEYCGQGIEAYEQEVRWWQEELERALGTDWRAKKNRCAHCGNGRVRWITVAHHAPTGEKVVFGADCTERLGFENRQAFKLAQLRSKAEAGHARLKVWKARCAFLEANPTVAAAIEQAKGAAHAKNTFVADVLGKLDRFGSISERQVAAVLSSLQRDLATAERKAAEAVEVKGDAPSGRVTVTGEILTVKDQEGAYGVVTKMLLKLANNSKVWLTAPGEMTAGRGDTITVTATFEVSRDDKSFAFGKRPHLVAQPAAKAAL